MKRTYRECEVDAHRGRAMGGWDEVYWSAYSSDGYEIAAGFGGGTVREMYAAMKVRVDEFLDVYGGDLDKPESGEKIEKG